MRIRPSALGSVTALLLAGCSGGGGSADAAVDARLVDAGGVDAAPAFACVGSVTWPAAPAASAAVRIQTFEHYTGRSPFSGLTVDACAAVDGCAAPLATGTTDATGAVSITLPTPGQGFAGYIHVASSDVIPIYWTSRPPIADSSSRWLHNDLVVFTPAEFTALALSLAGITVDPTKGHLIATTIDCTGALTTALQVIANGSAPANSLQSDSAWFNLAPGSVEVVAKLKSSGEVVGRVNATIAAGTVTAVHFGPTPLE